MSAQIKCALCNKEVESNEDIYFDVASSITGKDENRVDEEVCLDCIYKWINSKDGMTKVVLVRRVGDPFNG